jgi:hypothetical protein
MSLAIATMLLFVLALVHSAMGAAIEGGFQHLAARDEEKSGMSSTTKIIIIAVCVVAGVILLGICIVSVCPECTLIAALLWPPDWLRPREAACWRGLCYRRSERHQAPAWWEQCASLLQPQRPRPANPDALPAARVGPAATAEQPVVRTKLWS